MLKIRSLIIYGMKRDTKITMTISNVKMVIVIKRQKIKIFVNIVINFLALK